MCRINHSHNLRALLAVIVASALLMLARWLPPLLAVVPLIGAAAALLLWAQRDELARLWRRGLALLVSPRARWFMGGLALLVGVAALLLPDIARADEPYEPCPQTDIDCQMDRMKYSVLKYMALVVWQINRLFLALARWLEILREQLIAEDGFATGLVDTITEGMVAPFWFAVAVAVLFFAIGFFARPLMNFDLVEIRKGIRNFVLAMLLFALGGMALSGMENLRITVAQGLTGMVGAATTDMSGIESSLGYANPSPDDDATKMRTLTWGIYSPQAGADGRCGGGALTTRSGVTADAVFFQDLAAAYLYALPFDIWCPTFEGEKGDGLRKIGVLLPVNFALGGTDQTDQGAYFAVVGIGGNDDDTTREEIINKATNGVARMGFGVQLTLTGAIEQFMHLIFVIAMINSWLGMIISVIFVLFLPTEDLFFRHARDIFNILRASWIAAVWMGILMSLISVASSANNALLITGTGMLAMVVIVWQTTAALGVLVASLKTSMDSVGVAPQAVGGAAAGLVGAGFAVRDFQHARSAGHDTRRSVLEGMRGYEEGHAIGEKPLKGVTARSRQYLRRAERQDDLAQKLAAQAGATGNSSSSSNSGGDADSGGDAGSNEKPPAPPAPWYEQVGQQVVSREGGTARVQPVLVVPTSMPSTIEGEEAGQSPAAPVPWYEQTAAAAATPAEQQQQEDGSHVRAPSALEHLDARLNELLETPAGAREGQVFRETISPMLAQTPAPTERDLARELATQMQDAPGMPEATRAAAALVVNNPDNEQVARNFLDRVGQRVAESPHTSDDARATANTLFARLQHDESPGLPGNSAETGEPGEPQRVDSPNTMRYQRERQTRETGGEQPDSGATPISEVTSTTSDAANEEEERQRPETTQPRRRSSRRGGKRT